VSTLNPKSFIRKLLPTSHRILLIKKVIPLLNKLSKKILVVGAGYWPTIEDFGKNKTVIFSDINCSYPQVSIYADAHSLPFEDNTFNGLISLEVFEHLHDPNLASKEIYRVLNKNGIAIISIPFMFRIHGNPYDYQRFTKDGIKILFKQFKKVKVMEYGSRVHVISDLITTSNKFWVILRIFNHVISLFDNASKDCPSGYIIILTK